MPAYALPCIHRGVCFGADLTRLGAARWWWSWRGLRRSFRRWAYRRRPLLRQRSFRCYALRLRVLWRIQSLPEPRLLPEPRFARSPFPHPRISSQLLRFPLPELGLELSVVGMGLVQPVAVELVVRR